MYETTGTLTETLLDFIHTTILSPHADITHRLEVAFKIEDLNPNSSRRLDVDLVITDLETTQTQATEEEHGDCPICLDKLRGPKNINTFICNHKFHHECTTDWLYRKTTCPYCRRELI